MSQGPKVFRIALWRCSLFVIVIFGWPGHVSSSLWSNVHKSLDYFAVVWALLLFVVPTAHPRDMVTYWAALVGELKTGWQISSQVLVLWMQNIDSEIQYCKDVPKVGGSNELLASSSSWQHTSQMSKIFSNILKCQRYSLQISWTRHVFLFPRSRASIIRV